MTTNLRISLTILSVGFAIEGAGEAYSVASNGTFLPGTSLLLILPTAMTLVGLLFVWIGRHEWNLLHHSRVRHAHIVFGLSLLGGIVAAAVVGLLLFYPNLGVPPWASVLFGAAVGSLVLGTFVTYVVLIFHLVRAASRAALAGSLVWAVLVSAFVGRVLAGDLPTIIMLTNQRSLSVSGLIGPVSSIASFLFVSYFLLLAAYLDAHHRVAQGLRDEPPATGVPAQPGPST